MLSNTLQTSYGHYAGRNIPGSYHYASDPITTSQIRLWIIYDDDADLDKLKIIAGESKSTLTSYRDIPLLRDEIKESEIIVLDVDPCRLSDILKMLRDDLRLQKNAIYVNDRACKTLEEPCGLLPQYRAMICAWHELLFLVRRLLPCREPGISTRRLL